MCSSLESICIDSPVKQPSEKRKLSEILLEENSSNAENASTRSRKAWDTSSEDSAPETTTIYIAKSSPKKKDKKAEENQRAVSLKQPYFFGFLLFQMIYSLCKFLFDIKN